MISPVTNSNIIKKDENIISKKKEDNQNFFKMKEGSILLLTNILIIFIFSLVYYSQGYEDNWNGVNNKSTLFDFFYFSFTTMTTIGYGDISPKVGKTKILCIFQQLIVLFELANFFSNVIIKKPFKIKLLKRMSKNKKNSPITVGEKIGRQRRYNSCQLDYQNSRRRISQHHINVVENDNEVLITLPLPPEY